MTTERIPNRVPAFFKRLMRGKTHLMKQVEPDKREGVMLPELSWDPLRETKYSPVPYLVHRYPRIAMILVTQQCFAYCRYCFRAGFINPPSTKTVLEHWAPIDTYLREHPEISEVLLTGGDPFILSDPQLSELLGKVRDISPDLRIRIGTRAPIFHPKRFSSPEVYDVLEAHQPLTLYLHVNHRDEVTPELSNIVKTLMKRGMVCYSQSVLLRGVNDSVAALKETFMSLYTLGVHVGYLHLCDLAQGTAHFMVPVSEATTLWRGLWAELPGAAIPHLVFDDAEGGGKIPLHDKTTVTYEGERPLIHSFSDDKEGIGYPV